MDWVKKVDEIWTVGSSIIYTWSVGLSITKSIWWTGFLRTPVKSEIYPILLAIFRRQFLSCRHVLHWCFHDISPIILTFSQYIFNQLLIVDFLSGGLNTRYMANISIFLFLGLNKVMTSSITLYYKDHIASRLIFA